MAPVGQHERKLTCGRRLSYQAPVLRKLSHSGNVLEDTLLGNLDDAHSALMASVEALARVILEDHATAWQQPTHLKHAREIVNSSSSTLANLRAAARQIRRDGIKQDKIT
eukprot:12422834-Karenia_brevis.AAC.2